MSNKIFFGLWLLLIIGAYALLSVESFMLFLCVVTGLMISLMYSEDKRK